ncbi:coiled-coil domain-containing glutamate-rich protein 1 [Pteronotus mesoamericanus]|uniref:coiled-coil domain-containing glutamate-rich protein 1 n=1 Tax=Pteronotus mesoamericanus TaxID=1884717 RepID=UPI0023EDF400|nr:coiled-coil domain-containing glutamate-rich protein 1 [Pteronotus parnellii mesoamericanus]
MTQTLGNLGGGWASSAPFRSGSSCHQRRKGAPVYKPRHRYGPKAENEPPKKQPKQQHHCGHWFQPPQSPYWAMYSHWGCWGGPWCPPPMGYQKPPGPVQVTRMYGLHPVCLCCCSCCHGPWNPGWLRPPGRKKRWGRRGGGLRRHPRRPFKRSPPMDGSTLLRPVNLCGWRVPDMRMPGLQAPRNTTQFIMNQIYEDMRQQEELERQQEARRAQQAQAGGNDAPLSGGEEDTELQDTFYGFGQNPLALSPDPEQENQFPAPQLVEEEKEEKNDEHDEEECDGKEEESEEEDEEAEAQDEEEVEEPDFKEEEEEEEEEEEKIEEKEEAEGIEEEEGLEEDEQREEENCLPLDMPLSFLLGDEEERELYKLFLFKPPTDNS